MYVNDDSGLNFTFQAENSIVLIFVCLLVGLALVFSTFYQNGTGSYLAVSLLSSAHTSHAETEALIFWLPDVKSQLIGKEPDAGKD